MKDFRIIIADDEAFSRYALKTIITKNFPNAEIISESQDGYEVLKTALELKPDLILMDIKMPGMNGIEASEKILMQLPDTRIIILSAYDYFNYAQKSLDIGVSAYLLKPFKEMQIVERINNLRFKTGTSASVTQDVAGYLENELIKLLTLPWGKEIQIKKIMNFLNIPECQTGIVICLSGNSLSSRKRKWIRSLLAPGCRDICGETPDADFCFIGLFTSRNAADEYFLQLKGTISEISEEYSIGLSMPCGMKQLPTAYRSAIIALRHSAETGTAVFFSEDINLENSDEIYPFELEDKLIQALYWEDFQQGWELLRELCAEILNTASVSGYRTEKMLTLYILLKRTALKAGFFDFKLNNEFPVDALNSLDEEDQKVKFILNFYNRIEESASARSAENQTRKLSKAFQFIQQNILQDINLESAADFAGLSPQYLSRSFKEKYKVNFIDYLTEHRINHARYLLKSSDMNIKEIAAETGYSDPNYFSRVFRKTAGCSPQQYRLRS